MNEDIRRRVGVMRGDTLSVKVSPGVLDVEPYESFDDLGKGFDVGVDHSFTTIGSNATDDFERVTVTLQAGRTRLRVHGEEAIFDGFRYFPRNPADYDTVDYRGDPGDATVDFVPGDGSEVWPERLIDTIHPVTDTTVADLIAGLESGSIEPLPKRYTEE